MKESKFPRKKMSWKQAECKVNPNELKEYLKSPDFHLNKVSNPMMTIIKDKLSGAIVWSQISCDEE